MHYKMASLCCLMAIMFLISCLSSSSAHENQSTSLLGTSCNLNLKTTNNSANCSLRLNESFLEDVFRLMRLPTTNIIELKVSVGSANKSRRFPEMKWPWANEIGRTLTSLVAMAKEWIFTSPVFITVLTAGTEELSIEVDDKLGCLPPGNEGSDQIFEFLTRKLSTLASHDHSEDAHHEFYKLCRAHTDDSEWTTYNCCRITDRDNLVFCADYSSIVVEYALETVIAAFLVSNFLILPFVLEHIRSPEKSAKSPEKSEKSADKSDKSADKSDKSADKSDKSADNSDKSPDKSAKSPKKSDKSADFYKTSTSHMSLLSVVGKIFYEGKGQALSMLRRVAFVLLAWTVFLPDFYGFPWLRIIFGVWGGLFSLFDVFLFHIKHKSGCKEFPLDEMIIFYLTLPFAICFDVLSCIYEKYCSNEPTKKSTNKYIKKCRRIVRDVLYAVAISVVLAVCVCFVPFCAAVGLLIFTFAHIFPFRTCSCVLKEPLRITLLLLVLRIPSVIMLGYFTGMIFLFFITVVVGFFLNGEFFNPFVAPVVTLIIYFWKDWKFSVEAKCLQLKTTIVTVCKEKAKDGRTWEDKGTQTKDKATQVEDDNNKQGTHVVYKGQSQSENYDDENGENEAANNAGVGTSRGRWQDLLDRIRNRIKRSSAPSDNSEKDPKIVFDHNGEAMIAKTLYNEISKELLPLEDLLFRFFRRIIFVAVYGFVMFTVIILVRDSGISSNLQAVTTIAAVLIPFLFDTIWADHHLAQKIAKNEAMKEKLQHMITECERQGRQIVVHLQQPSVAIQLESQADIHHEESQPVKLGDESTTQV